MSIDTDRLRADLRLTAAREGWPEAEIKEIGAAIKAALDAEDEEALQGWAKQLAWWREMLVSFGPRLRDFEAEIKAEAASRRKAA